MNAKIEKGQLTIDVTELIEAMSPETRREVARFVAAKEELFVAVLECVTGGRFFTDDRDGEWWFGEDAVLRLREKLIPLMPDVARRAVTEALRQRNRADGDAAKWQKWAWSLFHAWPEGRMWSRPELPKWTMKEYLPSEQEVDGLIGNVERSADDHD
jgi:hypothetical protein